MRKILIGLLATIAPALVTAQTLKTYPDTTIPPKISAHSILCNPLSSVGVPSQCTASQVKSLLAITSSDISGVAPLASPTFTGTPTAPTASANDNSTKIATTAYVDRQTPIPPTIGSHTLLGNGTGSTAAPTALTQLDSFPIGQTTPAAGAFTTLAATSLFLPNWVICTNGSTGSVDAARVAAGAAAVTAAGGGTLEVFGPCTVNGTALVGSHTNVDLHGAPMTAAAAANWSGSVIGPAFRCADNATDVAWQNGYYDWMAAGTLVSVKVITCNGEIHGDFYSNLRFLKNTFYTPGDAIAVTHATNVKIIDNICHQPLVANSAGACFDVWDQDFDFEETGNSAYVTTQGIGFISTGFGVDNVTPENMRNFKFHHNYVEMISSAHGAPIGFYNQGQQVGLCSAGTTDDSQNLYDDNIVVVTAGVDGIPFRADFCSSNLKYRGNTIVGDGVTVATHPAIEVTGGTNMGVNAVIDGNMCVNFLAPASGGSDGGVFLDKGAQGRVTNNTGSGCGTLANLVGTFNLQSTTIVAGNSVGGDNVYHYTTPIALDGTVSGAGIAAYLAAGNPGAFSTLSASGAVSGAGFSTYLASPPAIGGTTPAAGTFSSVTSTGNVYAGAGTEIGWTGRGILTSPAANQLRFGPADSATPSGQQIFTQGARGGTDTNVGGGNLTIQSGAGTGTGTASSLTLKTPQIGSTGTTLQSQVIGISITPTQIQIGNGTSNPNFFFGGSGTFSGTPITGLFASPPALGGTVAAAGTFTTLSASTSITDTLLSTAGIVTNTSAGLFGSVVMVPVANGGTGAITLTGPLKGNGTSAISAAAAADVYGLWSGTCNSTTFLRGDGSCQSAGSGSPAYSTIAAGTNTTAAMVVGTGASLAASGSGSITATAIATGAALGTPASVTLTNATGLPAATGLTGTIAAAQMPALTGDVTNTAGSLATTVKGINGTLMSGLGTGIVKNTTTTGVPSIAVAADFPTLNQNTSGTASNLSGTPALPNGTTATTQSAGDTTTDLATDAFVAAIFAAPPALGSTTPAAVSATTLAASSTVSGTGFSTYLASPPAIGGTSAAAGSFTALNTSSGLNSTTTGADQLAAGTTAQRPAGTNGQCRYNSTFGYEECYNSSKWRPIGGIAVVPGCASGAAVTHTGDTAETNVAICTIPAAMVCSNCGLRVTEYTSRSATSTDTVNYVVRWSGTSGDVAAGTVLQNFNNASSGSVGQNCQSVVFNANATGAQVAVGATQNACGFSATAVSSAGTGTLDTTAVSYVNLNCKDTTSSADTCGFKSWFVEVISP